MPQLPTLRTDFNVIAPDIKNALLAGRKMKEESEDKANVLLDRSIATEKRKLDTSTSKSQSLMNISKAAMGTDTELVKKLVSIHNQTYEDAKTDVPEQIGPIQKLKLGRITFEGTADGIQNLIDLQLKHPGVTPEDDVDLPTPDGNVVKVKFKSLLARAAVRNKVNLSVEEPKRTDAEEIEYQGRLAEEKARGKSKGEGPKEDKYLKDKGAIVDDTNTFYRDKAKSLLDPDSGLVRFGPDGDENKYLDEYNQLFAEKAADMVRIRKGELPSWLQGDVAKPEPKPKEFAPVELEEAKRAMAQAHDELLSSGALEGLSKEDAFELTKKRARELTSGDSQGL